MILFIDDEPRRIEPYIEELNFSGYQEIELKENVDEALLFFQENKEKITLIILDIMMPIGNSFDNQAQQQAEFGLNTGIYFYQQYLQGSIPVILWTNSYDAELPDAIADKKVSLIRKINYKPYQFVTKVKEILNNSID